MNTLLITLKYFITITIELIVLFVLISAIIDLILQYIPEEKIQKRLSGKGIIGNIVGAGFGALRYIIPKPAREISASFSLIIDETMEQLPNTFASTIIICSRKRCNGIISSEIDIERSEIHWK